MPLARTKISQLILEIVVGGFPAKFTVDEQKRCDSSSSNLKFRIALHLIK